MSRYGCNCGLNFWTPEERLVHMTEATCDAGMVARLTAELADARLQLEAMRWRKVSEGLPTADEVEIAFWDGTLMCRCFGAWDAEASAWYSAQEPIEEHWIKVVAWRPCGDLPPAESEPTT